MHRDSKDRTQSIMPKIQHVRVLRLIPALWILLVLEVASPLRNGWTQEESYILRHENIFGKLQRPPVIFPHEKHMEIMEQKGCGVCHHLYNEYKRALYYEQGEERACTDCHGIHREGSAPSLMHAYHGSCMRCHRIMVKTRRASAPTTCGECHSKR